jgi:hypothetical protein
MFEILDLQPDYEKRGLRPRNLKYEKDNSEIPC